MPDTDKCNSHPEIVALKFPLLHFKEALERQRKIKIVAIGSSTTAGEGVIPYPHRLELALRDFTGYPGRMIDVINRGIGGQEAPEELARFECDVLNEQPALVIWQVGTNAIYHRSLYDPLLVARNITTGLGWLKQIPTDVILMDLQFAPALLEDDQHILSPEKEVDTRKLVALIAAAADKAKVNLFPRFALMEQWVRRDGIPITDLIKEDRIHQTELGTACVSKALAAAIIAATDFHETLTS
jgi:hypothetical protein